MNLPKEIINDFEWEKGDIDESNYYQRYTNLYYKWSSIILDSKHPLEETFENDPSIKTETNTEYLREWKQYLIN